MATRSRQRRAPRCCRCNGSAKCLRCACVRSQKFCSCCLPGVSGNCCNNVSVRPHVQPIPSNSQSPKFLRADSTDHERLATDSTLSGDPNISHSSSSAVFIPAPSGPSLPSLSFVLGADIPTLQHIPKGARDCWAQVLSVCLTAVVDSDDLSQWTRLSMLAKCVLASPATGYRLRWCEILRLVMSCLLRWLDGDIDTLWSEALECGWALLKRRKGMGHSSSSNAHRARLAVQSGIYGKAIKALSSAGLATPSPEVTQEMLNKHPQTAPPTLPHGSVPSPTILSEAIVLKGVRSFPNDSAPGPSHLRSSHLRGAVGCPSPDRASRLLSALTRFINLLASGSVPPSVVPHLCGATLLALHKKSGGLRPIAVGEVLWRLASKCLANIVCSQILSSLSPLQMGIGVKGGCEAIIHTTFLLLASKDTNICWTLLDFSNAFNSVQGDNVHSIS